MLRIAEEALTFDDVLLLPAHSTVLPRTVNLLSRITEAISLNIPLISAAMDTVTEARLAIAMAQEGGLGVIHKSMTIEQQAREVRAVKKYESGVVKDPITISAQASVRDLVAVMKENNISGMPVMNGSGLAGIVTSRDIDFLLEKKDCNKMKLSDVMTPVEELTTAKAGVTLQEANKVLEKSKKGTIQQFTLAAVTANMFRSSDWADQKLSTSSQLQNTPRTSTSFCSSPSRWPS